MDKLKPKNRREEVAIFRYGLVGGLLCRDLVHGELGVAIEELAKKLVRPPGSATTRTYSVPTYERWYYGYKEGGLDSLTPSDRSHGHGLELDEKALKLLVDIRTENRWASAALIRRTLIAEGLLEEDEISEPTLRRLYADRNLPRLSRRGNPSKRERMRWQAESPGDLWQGDVCHGAPILVGDSRKPIRIHGLLDDASRYVVALEAMHTEREVDMLNLFANAVRRFGAPRGIYLDNGSTYVGESLRVACARLGVTLIHPQPYDPESRGKIERFWRTLREGCLDYIGNLTSLHEINVRLNAWLDEHYHKVPHAGLMGRVPGKVFREGLKAGDDGLDESKLKEAFTVRERRRVRKDNTVSVEGEDFEVDQGFLAGKIAEIAYCSIEQPIAPWIELEKKRYRLHRIDPVANGSRRRKALPPEPKREVNFDPVKTLLDRATGRIKKREGGDE